MTSGTPLINNCLWDRTPILTSAEVAHTWAALRHSRAWGCHAPQGTHTASQPFPNTHNTTLPPGSLLSLALPSLVWALNAFGGLTNPTTQSIRKLFLTMPSPGGDLISQGRCCSPCCAQQIQEAGGRPVGGGDAAAGGTGSRRRASLSDKGQQDNDVGCCGAEITRGLGASYNTGIFHFGSFVNKISRSPCLN